MGSPITQLSKAKFGIGGRVFNPIRDQKELFVSMARKGDKTLSQKSTVTE
jgi:hypothetical protein